MPNIIQTGKDVGAFFNSWVTYVNAAGDYRSDPNSSDAQQGLIAAAQALSGAVATLGKSPTLASALGTVAGITDMPVQLNKYDDALRGGLINEQNAALSSIAGDAASIAGTAATAIGALATQTGNSELGSLMGEIAEHANDFALAVGTVGTAVDVGNWFNSAFLPAFNKWIGNAPPQLDEDMLLNLNDPSGDSEIITPGQAGDTLTETKLSGNAFQYTESNPQGSVTSTAQLAYNGSADDLVVNGVGVVADVGGFQISLANGSGATVNGNNNVCTAANSANLLVNGTNNNITAGSNANLSTTGSQNATTVTGTGTTVNDSGTSDSVALNGNNDTATSYGANSTITSSASGDNANLNGISNTGNAYGTGSNVNADGSGDKVNLVGNNDTSTAWGTNDTLQSTGSGEQLYLQSNNNTGTTYGSSSTISSWGSSDNANLNGTGDTGYAYGTGSNVNADSSSDQVNLVGNNDTTTAWGTNDTLQGTGSGEQIYLQSNNNTGTTYGSSSTIASWGSSDNANLNGTGDTGYAYGTGSNVNADSSGDKVNLVGNNNTTTAWGTNDTLQGTGSGEQMYLQGNDDAGTTYGISSTIASWGTGDDANLNGSGDTGYAYGTGSNINADSSGDKVDLAGNNDTTTAWGTNDTLQGTGSGEQFYLQGNDDSANAYGSGSTIASLGSGDGSNLQGGNDTGASQDPGSSGEPEDPEEPGVDVAGFAGSQDTINRTLGSGMDAVAQAVGGGGAGFAAAEAGLHESALAAQLSALTGGTGSSIFEGGRWNGDTLTWSLGEAGAAGSPFSSSMSSSEEALVEQAFATWAAASGVKFEEVSDPSKADITLGFADLDTSGTGLVGMTDYAQQSGTFASGTTIRLEDPNQDALTAGSDGQLTYAGTDAQLEQVLLHEIGHALGLASNADARSIMYYELNATNRTLDATDLAGIQSLYGGQALASLPPADSTLSQMIQAMASYGVPGGGVLAQGGMTAEHPLSTVQ
jgi:hypothetical protein